MGGGLKAKIAIERLTRNVTREHLEEIFSVYGRIMDIFLPIRRETGANKGFAHITFASEEGAQKAIKHMDKGQLDGNVLEVAHWVPREPRRRPSLQQRRPSSPLAPRRYPGYNAPRPRPYRPRSPSPYHRHPRSPSPRYRRPVSRTPQRYRSISRTPRRNRSISRTPPRRQQQPSRTPRRQPSITRTPPRRQRSISRTPPRRRYSRSPRRSRTPPRRPYY